MKLRGEEQQLNATAKIQDDVRLDIREKGFWVRGQTELLDVRVFNLNAKR